MDEITYIVYVQTNDNNRITAVNSSAFISDVTDWTQIDEGEGDKYQFAQGNYFDNPIMTDGRVYRYTLIDGEIGELTDEEIAEEEAEITAVAETAAQITELKQQLADADYKIIKCIECSLNSEDLPYDIETLHTERQSIRNQINELES